MAEYDAVKDGHWTTLPDRTVSSNLFLTCVLHHGYIEKSGEAFTGTTTFNGVTLSFNRSTSMWDQVDTNGIITTVAVGTKLHIQPENMPTAFRDMIKGL
jgi:hypothetical protein